MIITVELPVLRQQLRVLEQLAAVPAATVVLLADVGEVRVELLLGRRDGVVGRAVLTGSLQMTLRE